MALSPKAESILSELEDSGDSQWVERGGAIMTGQLFARGPYPGPDGKEVWMLAGIVTSDQLKNGTQYTIGGPLVLVNPVNLEKQTNGEGIQGVLRMPIWRV